MINLKKLRPKNFNLDSENYYLNIVRFVEKNHGFKKVYKCPVCSFNKSEIYINHYNINFVRCLRCDLTYSEKHPKNFDDFYSSEDSLKDTLNTDKTRKYRIKRFAVERIKILKKFKKRGSLLDFGCGTGWFLEEARKHYDVMGVEYSDNLRDWLKRKFDISTSKDGKDIKKKFDIITAFDVIEHVPDPLNFLRKLKKKLKKNGIIFVYTPNIDSLGFAYLKEKNNLLNPYHLFYFNSRSFEFLCSKANMKVIETQYKGIDIGDIYGLMNRKRNFKTAKYLKKNFKDLQNFVDTTNFSNHVRFVIKNK